MRSISEIEEIVVGVDGQGTPVLVKNLGTVTLGPDIRRGIVDLDGEGDVVGGIIVMRAGENALNVIDRVKDKIKELKPSMPKGVDVVATYDRSELIRRSIDTLKEELLLEIAIVSIVILVFLWHIPSAIIPILTIPVSVALAFLPMYYMGLTSNIMSLTGMAISIGVLVDGAIVEVENAYKRLEQWIEGGRQGDFHEVRLNALKEVGPSVFFSLLVIAVAFMPVFTLVDQEGRLFKPLAYTKNLAMAIAALLAITLDPAIRMLFTRMDPWQFRPRWLASLANKLLVGRYYPEERHPISKRLFQIYEPVCNFVLRHKGLTIVSAVLLVLTTIPAYMQLGSEFMPPLYEGDLLYMPVTLPGISVTEARELMQTMDQILMDTPEVERVFGKAGRADTSLDPAPFSMLETTIVLKPMSEWRKVERWYSGWPEWLQVPLRHLWSDRITPAQLEAELDQKMQFPGVSNAWTMPIKARVDMLSTGVRTPIGIKIMGADLDEIQRLGTHLESILKPISGTRSVFAERTGGGYFVDFVLKREALARYGLTIKQAEEVIVSAVGGETITTTIEGRERYSVNVRYARELRDNVDKLRRVLVPTTTGAQVPLAELAEIKLVSGPAMIRDENALLTGYVYVDLAGRDVGGYVEEAKLRGGTAARASHGLYPSLERAIREHGPREGAAEAGRARHAVPDLRAAVYEYAIGRQGGHRDASRAVLADRRHLVSLAARLPHVDRGVGRHDRIDGARRRDRRVHAAVSRLVLLRRRAAGQDANLRGSARGDHPRRREARAAQDDDGHGGHDGPGADHVVVRHGRRHDETDRRADDRRPGHQFRSGTARVPVHLRHLEMAL